MTPLAERIVLRPYPYMVSLHDSCRNDLDLALVHDTHSADTPFRHMLASVEVLFDRRWRPCAARPSEEEGGDVGPLQQPSLDEIVQIPDGAGVPYLEFRSHIVFRAGRRILGELFFRVEHVALHLNERLVVMAEDDRDHIGLLLEDLDPLWEGWACH